MLGDYALGKRVAVLAALVYSVQAKACDDIAEMFCRRVATLTKRFYDELETIKQKHREITEGLVANYRSVLERIDPDGMNGGPAAGDAGGGLQDGGGRGRVRCPVQRHRRGGSADLEAVPGAGTDRDGRWSPR